MDSRAVAEYIRALVATDAIDEYLPDEQSGKPSSLPTLVINHASFFFLTKYFSFGRMSFILVLVQVGKPINCELFYLELHICASNIP